VGGWGGGGGGVGGGGVGVWWVGGGGGGVGGWGGVGPTTERKAPGTAVVGCYSATSLILIFLVGQTSGKKVSWQFQEVVMRLRSDQNPSYGAPSTNGQFRWYSPAPIGKGDRTPMEFWATNVRGIE